MSLETPGLISPIEDYAVIGDCRSAALISRTGSIDWCCWPLFDSASLFARILDWNRGGHFSLQPSIPFRSSHHYLKGTNVLVTRFETDSGTAELTDLMPVMDVIEKRRHLLPFREILRRLHGLEGEVPFRLEFVPRPDYGRLTPRFRKRSDSLVECRIPGAFLFLGGDASLQVDESQVNSQFVVGGGERRLFSLTYSDDAPAVRPQTGSAAEEKVEQTVQYWRTWIASLRYRGPNPEAIERSALALKLMLYAPSGAMIAAPTTSLPEHLGGERNWDYRYCWLRDASFTARAFYQLGFAEEGESYSGWLLHATSLTHPGLRVLYDVYGRTRLEEEVLPHLEGHRGSAPVRIGNDAFSQNQLDVYGELLMALDEHVKNRESLDRDTRKLITQIGDLVSRSWDQPDHGIWEVRSGTFHHVHGKVMCWAALDCLIRFQERGLLPANASAWTQARDAIRDAVLTRGFSAERGTFVSIFEGNQLDASLLTIPMSGFLPGDDPRMLATISAIQSSLGEGDLVYRYRGFDDGLRGDEGAFLACSFWLVNALALGGKRSEAIALFERLNRRANQAGLFSEEMDPATGMFLGNFPQGLTHIALINAGLSLQDNV